ncbi:type II secretion system protein [Flavisericum labens]|uniref:type II secretion system protein n=1 Tax=Flavisericum labens TaxID=3377112 RepID=UPI00387A8C69
MKTDSKIKAFTLSELVVVLILTSIVVGMAFSVLDLVQKHMAGIQDNFNKKTELNRLEQSLWLDFNTYPNIEYKPFDDTLVFSNEIDSTVYSFHKEFIVKATDTFQISIKSKTLYFLGAPIPSGKLDALKLETSKDFQSQKLFVFKENDATHFMDGI